MQTTFLPSFWLSFFLPQLHVFTPVLYYSFCLITHQIILSISSCILLYNHWAPLLPPDNLSAYCMVSKSSNLPFVYRWTRLSLLSITKGYQKFLQCLPFKVIKFPDSLSILLYCSHWYGKWSFFLGGKNVVTNITILVNMLVRYIMSFTQMTTKCQLILWRVSCVFLSVNLMTLCLDGAKGKDCVI